VAHYAAINSKRAKKEHIRFGKAIEVSLGKLVEVFQMEVALSVLKMKFSVTMQAANAYAARRTGENRCGAKKKEGMPPKKNAISNSEADEIVGKAVTRLEGQLLDAVLCFDYGRREWLTTL